MTSKEFKRTDNLFSLCGLNCNLCPMFVRKQCGGCFSDSPCYLTCPIAPCSVEHGGVEYCFECGEYPCDKYDGIDLNDSLISHKNQLKDMEKAKTMGIEKYKEEQLAKKNILDKMLKDYDDGHSDVFFCLAVNLLELYDLMELMNNLGNLNDNEDKNKLLKEKLHLLAEKNDVVLELRR